MLGAELALRREAAAELAPKKGLGLREDSRRIKAALAAPALAPPTMTEGEDRPLFNGACLSAGSAGVGGANRGGGEDALELLPLASRDGTSGEGAAAALRAGTAEMRSFLDEEFFFGEVFFLEDDEREFALDVLLLLALT